MCNFASMNLDELREYCLSLERVTEDMPFDDSTLAFRVGEKIFCLASLEENLRINLKCDPLEAIEIREAFPAVIPGFHMNKKYWNTVLLDGSISDSMLKVWISNSYNLVRAGLSKKKRQEAAQSERERKGK